MYVLFKRVKEGIWTLHVYVWETFFWSWSRRALKTFAADFLSSERGNSEGRMKSSTLFTLDHASFSTWLSAAQLFLRIGSRTTYSHPIPNECPDHKITVLTPYLFDRLLIPRLFLYWFCFGRRGESAILTYSCFHLLEKFEICHLEECLKCIFHILECHSAILKNVETSTNVITSPSSLVSKESVINEAATTRRRLGLCSEVTE